MKLQGIGRILGSNPVSALITGIIAGIDNIGSGLAIATLLFAGPLASGLGLGVGIILLGGFVLALFVALRSTYPNSIALIQETNIAILATVIASMAANLDGPIEAKIATAFAIIGASSLLSGVLLWGTGKLGLGKMTRILPYPVIAGFLAGTGWLLVEGTLVIITGEADFLTALNSLVEDEALWRMIPTIALAGALIFFTRLFPHPATMAVTMIGAIPLFYGFLYINDISLDAARQMGQLPDIDLTTDLLLPDIELFVAIDWPSVFTAMPVITAAAMLSLVGFLLNVSGLELATGRDIDLDKELRATGIANLLSGGFGGPSGYTGFSITMLAEKLGVRDRSGGIATALIMLLGFTVAGPLIVHMPVFLTAGLILFIGYNLLNEWCISLHSKLPFSDWAIILVIVASVMMMDFMAALGVGLLVSIGVFVYNYSKQPVVRQRIDGTERTSTIERSPDANKALKIHRGTIEILQLQGYLFFGTADRMVSHLRERLNAIEHPPLKHLILDMQHVGGVDSAAVTCFVKIQKLAGQQQVNVQLTQVSDHVLTALKLGGVDFEEKSPFGLNQDIDHALEQIEEHILSTQAEEFLGTSLEQHFTSAIGQHAGMANFIAAMERMTLQPGQVLIKAGEATSDVYFIETGRLEVQLVLKDGNTIRLSALTDGAIVGEIALYLENKRTADVIAKTNCTLYKLSPKKLASLEKENPELALLAHRLMASNLSQKMIRANRMIQSQS